MGRKDSFIAGFEKRAAFKWYENLKAQQAKPISKLKRTLGWGAIGGAAGFYGVHKLTQDPEEKMLSDQQRQNQARH
ncbi:MAG: hypothetical protein EBZ49_00165 [Proteobacteria bacterium]|nr:hypothetical protein [Pseudomonadota bacterium]